MDSHLDHDLAALPDLLAAVQQYATGILADLDDRPVAAPPAAPVPDEPLPRRGAGTRAAPDRLGRRWGPGFSASAGPRYLGFVTGGSTPAALDGDWLAGVFDQNAASGEDSSADQLEKQAIAWLRELFGLTAEHHGAFVSGATMS